MTNRTTAKNFLTRYFIWKLHLYAGLKFNYIYKWNNPQLRYLFSKWVWSKLLILYFSKLMRRRSLYMWRHNRK